MKAFVLVILGVVMLATSLEASDTGDDVKGVEAWLAVEEGPSGFEEHVEREDNGMENMERGLECMSLLCIQYYTCTCSVHAIPIIYYT
jgi:hypothetical protein